MYTINIVLHNRPDRNDLHKVMIRVTYLRKHTYYQTDFKVLKRQFNNGRIIDHPHKNRLNAAITKRLAEVEEKMLKMMDSGEMEMAKTKADRTLSGFILEYVSEVTGKMASATIQVYTSLAADVAQFGGDVLRRINIKWIHGFEQKQRELWEVNTINKKMKHIKAFLRRAAQRGYIDEKSYNLYKVPNYVQKVPFYLSEEQIMDFKAVCDSTKNKVIKTSGYYFLLSCYAGYRLSDLKRFNKEMIRDNKIILKTKKNNQITSMPIHPRCRDILDYCINEPLTVSEQHMREHIKEIARMAGIKGEIKIHTGRHSFAMLISDKGFDLEEIAELLGITPKVASVYTRISNKRLEKKILERL